MAVHEVGYQVSKLNMSPDRFLMEYDKRHPQGPRITVYDRSDTKSWKKYVPLMIVFDNGDYRIGHVDYVHYKLLTEDVDGRPGDH
jgi:hypothetical protein